ncbi:MAG: Fe(3+) ABC transporter substrate-binding protein [Lentisphaeria bacterium]|nr:Fe(3+) ABC transporter substrate-binding protein [Lentisphaeria bacterium]
MFKKLGIFFGALLLGTSVVANEVTVYSHRHYDADKKLFDEFTRETGITVNVIKAKSDELIKRLELEGENTNADVLVTVDAGRLYRAKSKDLLQVVESKTLEERIPAHLRDPDKKWFGLTVRARVIVYSKDRVKPPQLSTYADLANPQWKGKILIRKSTNIYNQSLLASVIAHNGEEKAIAWAEGVKKNMARKPKGNDRGQVLAVAAGEGDLAIVNTYYLGIMQNAPEGSKEWKEQREAFSKVSVFFPDQKGNGTHINVSGAGVTKHAPNKANAIKLIEFLSSKKAQEVYAKENFEFPVLSGVELSTLLKSWGDFKRDDLSLNKLGELNSEASKVFDIVGWDN